MQALEGRVDVVAETDREKHCGGRVVVCDVLVVGAGPAGSTAARTCASLGLRTILLEEHPEVGCPTHCTGKLSLHGFERFDIPASLIQTTLRAARLYAPDGTVAGVRRPVADSHVVDRDPFDRFLAHRASEAGAEIIAGAKARTVQRVGVGSGTGQGQMSNRGSVQVRVERRADPLVITAPLVIDAEGANPVLPPQLNISPRRTLVHGLQYELEGVDLYFGRDVAPVGFGEQREAQRVDAGEESVDLAQRARGGGCADDVGGVGVVEQGV